MIDVSSDGVAVLERTVVQRLVQSGITEERALQHVRDGWVRVDGEPVTDPSHPAEPPAQLEFRMIAEPYRGDQRS